jgi:hypothetical protein
VRQPNAVSSRFVLARTRTLRSWLTPTRTVTPTPMTPSIPPAGNKTSAGHSAGTKGLNALITILSTPLSESVLNTARLHHLGADCAGARPDHDQCTGYQSSGAKRTAGSPWATRTHNSLASSSRTDGRHLLLPHGQDERELLQRSRTRRRRMDPKAPRECDLGRYELPHSLVRQNHRNLFYTLRVRPS